MPGNLQPMFLKVLQFQDKLHQSLLGSLLNCKFLGLMLELQGKFSGGKARECALNKRLPEVILIQIVWRGLQEVLFQISIRENKDAIAVVSYKHKKKKVLRIKHENHSTGTRVQDICILVSQPSTVKFGVSCLTFTVSFYSLCNGSF